jgi:hypothetical protein
MQRSIDVAEPAVGDKALPLVEEIKAGLSLQGLREGSLPELFGGAPEQLEGRSQSARTSGSI